MGEIYILDDAGNSFTKKLITELKIKPLDYYELNNDVEGDEFVINKFQHHNIAKLLIPVSLGEIPNNQMGFKLGLHIRLSAEIGHGFLVPIIFISGQSLETLLLSRADRYGLIAVTEGSLLCGEDVDEIRANLAAIEPIAPKNYPKFLQQLIVDKPETMGPHSLANEWGVYQLDRVANLNSLGAATPAFLKTKTLYFKYLRAKNNFANVSSNPAPVATGTAGPNTLDAIGKKILYIDDEAYKGWTNALKIIFKGGTLTTVTGEGMGETDFFVEIRKQIALDWDLILLDLRLLPLKEDVAGVVLPITTYSGTQILEAIKTLNEGTQVIIFTASNKAWNMKQLLDLKADGYYIKESPEYLIPDPLSLKNYEIFKAQVGECFERIYLKHIFIAHRMAIQQTIFGDANFLQLSTVGLKRSFDLIRLGEKEAAYLNYFQVIEQYLDLVFSWADKSVIDLAGVKQLAQTGRTYHLTYHDDQVTPPYLEKADSTNRLKYTALCKLSFVMAFKFGRDDSYLRQIATLVQSRNDIAHTGTSALLQVSHFFELIAIIHEFRSNI